MATLTFQLPAGLSPELRRELERASFAGGPGAMPVVTNRRLQPGQLMLSTSAEDYTYLVAPWKVDRAGLLMCSSATLMDRQAPYQLLVELTRGKINQVRNQAVLWETGGMRIPDPLRVQLLKMDVAFARAVCSGDFEERQALASQALALAYQAADTLTGVYTDQVFALRQQQGHFDKLLSCPLQPGVPLDPFGEEVRHAFNGVSLPLSWHQIEADEAVYRWEDVDRLLSWAEAHDLEVTAGPLLDFSSSQLPAWLWRWERDLASMVTFMGRFVDTAVRRYRNRIRRWQITAASNWASVLSLGEDELLGLTFRLCEIARQIDPGLQLIVGISQPWGEYLSASDRPSPFIFADNLIRSGLSLAALNLEVIMGVQGRGSYCHDLLDTSRLLDLYALLGVPLQVTLGYPAQAGGDADADPEMAVAHGHWRDGFDPATQERWAASFASLALSKPCVQAVHWAHLSDALPHLFPHCGLIGPDGQRRPTLAALGQLRAQHLP